MESRSQDNQSGRPRGNRSGGRSRNRNGNANRQGNQSNSNGSSSGNSRSRNRNGSSRSRSAPKQTTGQKILSFLTFGLLGKPKSKGKPNSKSAQQNPRPARDAAKSAPRESGGDTRPKRNRNEVTSARLYVGNLDYATGEPELEALFRGVGNVISAEVVTNPRTQQSKGFAFVEMGSLDEARRAVAVLDDQDFMGRKLIVSGARSEGPHDNEGEAVTADSTLASEE
ncbi:MAG TPA: hypothetical protein PK648_16680 [Verrucomicrobiales bacterium]|jgi:hypothetical protein|nr:hypothetical protein [Verrucomicrobiales bacterium]